MNKIILLFSLLLGVNSTAQKTEIDYFNEAKARLERSGASHLVKSDINKALEFNSENTEYRWIRVRCNMTSSSSSDDFKQAIEDINFILSKEKPSAKLFANLGLAHKELGGEIYRYKKAKTNDGFSDDNSEYIKEQSLYFQEAIDNYQKAIIAYNNAIEIDESIKEKLNFEIMSCNKDIEKIKIEIQNLK